jgi:hypothetical protein
MPILGAVGMEAGEDGRKVTQYQTHPRRVHLIWGTAASEWFVYETMIRARNYVD